MRIEELWIGDKVLLDGSFSIVTGRLADSASFLQESGNVGLTAEEIKKRVSAIPLTKVMVQKFKEEYGFPDKKDCVTYLGNVGIEHNKEVPRDGYKETWSVYYKIGVFFSVFRGIKCVHEMQHALINAGKYEMAKNFKCLTK